MTALFSETTDASGGSFAGRRARRPAALPVLCAMAALILGACGGDSSQDAAPAAGAAPEVVASTGIAADIVAAVAGDDLAVEQLVPDGAVPHSYSPSAAERQEVEGAGLFVYFSPALEEGLPVDSAAASFEIADHIGPAGEGGDPHIWLDPTLIADAMPALAAQLGDLDPEHAEAFEERAERFAAELRDLDEELAMLVAAVPPERRKLVTSHDQFQYFADRYDFDVVGAPFGFSPEAEASAASVAGLIEAVEAEGVPVVFAQQGDDPDVLRTLADEAGVAVVDDLLVESLSAEADTYPAMLRLTTQRISEALAG